MPHGGTHGGAILPAQEADRTRVGATCSRKFKAKVEDYAERHGKTVADVVIKALADLLVTEILAGDAPAAQNKEEEHEIR